MITPYYCPDCGLRLRENKLAGGGVDAGQVSCKNGHVWTMFHNPNGDRFTLDRPS